MKKKHLILITLASLAAISCYQEDEFPPKPTSRIEFAQESDSELLLDETAATRTVAFSSAKAWTATVVDGEQAAWCNVSPASGKGGNVKISISVEQNDTPDERKTSILLKSGVTQKTISVNQKPSNSILLSPSTVKVEAKGGVFSLIAKATEACSVSVPEQFSSWINAATAKSVSTVINYTVAENTSLVARTGQIIVSNTNGSETVTIEQEAAKPVISLSKSNFDFSEEGGGFSVEVSSNVSLSVNVSEPWISAGTVEGSNYNFTVLANETTQTRTGSIVFGNEEFGVSATVTVTQSGKKDEHSIRILAIGNSFSDDAMEYLYQILEQAGYQSIKLGNLYIGGCTLATHADNITSGSASYDYRTNIDGKWTTSKSFSSVDAIKSDNWDYISMQQASGSSGMTDSYEPYLTTLITKVKELCPDAKLMWHMTWAYQQTSTHSEFGNYNKDQMTMYNAIINAVKTKVLAHNEFETVIPCGTAIQNLRTSVIGDNLTRDGYHLSTDKGRYVAALMWAKQISGCDLSKISWKPAGVIYTAKQLEAIKEAVNNAYEHPYEVTASKITEDNEDVNKSLETLLKAGGYNPAKYTRLEFDLIWPGYYNSTSNIPMTVQTNMKNYAATKVFTKEELPVGSLIVQKAGQGYRPEGWVAADQKNSARPDNVNLQIVEVTDEWWGSFTLRGFNVFKSGVSDLSTIMDEIKDGFGIFVPKQGGASNPELEAIMKNAGYNPADYTMLEVEITTYSYYNSSDKNMLSSPGTNMANYAATNIIPKADIPNGSIIVQKDGYQYRPEGWTALDEVTSGRPGNVTDQIVVVDDAWWREFNYRAFNLAEKGNPKLDDARQEALKTAFGIYVPKK